MRVLVSSLALSIGVFAAIEASAKCVARIRLGPVESGKWGGTGHRARWRAVALVWCALLLVPRGAVSAQVVEDARVTAETRRVYTTAMSPYCPGYTLDACPSPQAAVLKDSIRTVIRAGASADEVIASLEAQFGDQVRGAPRVTGFGAVAWFSPYVLFLLGAWFVTRLLRRSVRVDAPAPTLAVAAGTAPPELLARLEAAVRDDSGDDD